MEMTEATGAKYYLNTVTGQTSRTPPATVRQPKRRTSSFRGLLDAARSASRRVSFKQNAYGSFEDQRGGSAETHGARLGTKQRAKIDPSQSADKAHDRV